jgi:hypothetical protein
MSAGKRTVIRVAFLAAVAGLVAPSIVLLRDSDQATQGRFRTIDAREAVVNHQQRRLRLCVQAVDIGETGHALPGDPGLERQAKSRIRRDLKEAAKHPYWERFGYPELGSPEVDIGCPFMPLAFEAGQRIDRLGTKGILLLPGRRVERPSYYGVFVFVVPRDEFDEVFAGVPPATSEQSIASGDEISGVTLGLYLTREQLEDRGYMADMMVRAVGIKAFSDP